MTIIMILLIGFFLPLFPLSVVFNQALSRTTHVGLKIAFIFFWPQIGLLLLSQLDKTVLSDLAPWLLFWAALTALLYGFRLLAQRDMSSWIAFLATSAWSLLWVPALLGDNLPLTAYALSFSVPLILLCGLTLILKKGFGAAYTNLYAGLATSMPRFSGILVFTVLAATATPIFPAFFTMLHILTVASPLIAVLMVFAWLLWSWASARLLQGLIVGLPDDEHPNDISWFTAALYIIALLACVVIGFYWTGDAL